MEHLHLNINTFDSIVLGVIFISGVIAFFRGFLSELLSFGAWVGAAAITIYFFPNADALMHKYIKSEKVSAAAGALTVYFTALIIISILNSLILKYVKTGMQVGLLDNFLGLAFGVLRGLFVVSFGFLVVIATIPADPASQPDWLKKSVTKDYVREGSNLLVELAPRYMKDIEGLVRNKTEKKDNNANDTVTSSDKSPSPSLLDTLFSDKSRSTDDAVTPK